MIKQERRLLLCLSFVSLFTIYLTGLKQDAQGAELYFGAHGREVGVGKSFEIGVFINAEGDLVNAVEAKVTFPPGVELLEIRDGGSVSSLWIMRPQLTEGGQVSFAGLIPGGYFGDRGQLFSLILRAKDEGSITITTSDERVLLNDGQGTPVNVRRAPLLLNVSTAAIDNGFLPPIDADPPELFMPIIAHDPNLFSNQHFLAFATQDKGSGIKEYQVQERRFFGKPREEKWQTVLSPYLLQDQRLRSYVFVKAIDNDGNERMVVLPPQTPWYKDYTVFGIIVLVALLSYLIAHSFLWRPRRPRRL